MWLDFSEGGGEGAASSQCFLSYFLSFLTLSLFLSLCSPPRGVARVLGGEFRQCGRRAYSGQPEMARRAAAAARTAAVALNGTFVAVV